MDILCDECRYNSLDDESGEAFCSLVLDEDELARLNSGLYKNKTCRYFCPDKGEYEIVRKQN